MPSYFEIVNILTYYKYVSFFYNFLNNSQYIIIVLRIKSYSCTYTFCGRYSIALLSVAEDSVITLQKILTTSFYCVSISPLGTDMFVVSTRYNKPPVRTIDVHGNEGEVEHKLLPDKTYISWTSACAYIPSTKTLVFADADQHTVYMCDLTSGDGRVIKNDKIRGPRGVCAGPAGTVFVCSVNADSVVQLSQQGDVLASHSVDVRYPFAVSVSKDRLVLSNSSKGQKMIKLFNIV